MVFMDYGEIISDSIDYSKNALAGNWRTWLVFILCSLPFALMEFLFDPEKMQDAGYWMDFPWGQLCALLLAGFLLSFLTTGYLVRVFRGITPPPEFKNWVSLYLDGIKVAIVQVLWFIPFAVVLFCMIVLVAISSVVKGSGLALPVLIGLLFFAVIAIALLILIPLCVGVASVRYARTGSIREGIRCSAVIETIRAIGWGSYIIALLVLMITAIAFFLVVSVFGIIPFVGWVFSLVLNPFFFVFSARYLSRVYDTVTSPSPSVPGPATRI